MRSAWAARLWKLEVRVLPPQLAGSIPSRLRFPLIIRVCRIGSGPPSASSASCAAGGSRHFGNRRVPAASAAHFVRGGGMAMERNGTWTRRDFVRAGSCAGALVLLGSSRARGLGRWAAAPPGSALPVVDRLAVRVVVDNAQDALQRSARVGDVEVERVGMIMEPDLGRQVVSQFGLGYHLESRRGDETRNFLLDFGPTAQSELENLDLFQIDTAAVDALIMSHGHFDHFGGLMPLLQRDRAKMRRDLPLYVGGEDTFCYRWVERPSGERKSAGLVSRSALDRARGRLVMADQIGRASCRERVSISVVAVSLKKKRKENARSQRNRAGPRSRVH